ncbi:hypothetical protein [Capnocytophaga sp.]|uniref:hypothetical protein n=1 Tax=Capnocytophaga sp. TaxID=44737 RepID=UPI0026DD7F9F|nr:hypothetical protein [Capnocytophaga sp.]MDO5105288.1 hypothetical protein [Capnocytophaga sp.]
MTERIKILINNYFEGQTSLEEEKELQAYFNSKNVDVSLQDYKPLFAYLQEASNERKPAAILPFPTSKKRNLFQKIAVVAIFLPITFAIVHYKNYQKEQSEARMAFAQVKNALQMVSENYNKGTEKIAHLKEFDQTTHKIINLEKLK